MVTEIITKKIVDIIFFSKIIIVIRKEVQVCAKRSFKINGQ